MAIEIPDELVHDVDEQTFDEEKSLHLRLDEIKQMGEYILRCMCEPGQDFFAMDIPVKVKSIKDINSEKEIHFETCRKGKIEGPEFDETFNEDGFITAESIDLNNEGDQPGSLVTIGYLLGGPSIDIFGYKLFAYIKLRVPRKQAVKQKELVKV